MKHDSFVVWDEANRHLWYECKTCHVKVDLDYAGNCFAYLRKRDLLPPKYEISLVHHCLLNAITHWWHENQTGMEKSAIRGAFPGLSGDCLNGFLVGLLEAKAIIQGDCGCCYIPYHIAEDLGGRGDPRFHKQNGGRWISV